MLDNFPGGHQEECKDFWPINALKCRDFTVGHCFYWCNQVAGR